MYIKYIFSHLVICHYMYLVRLTVVILFQQIIYIGITHLQGIEGGEDFWAWQWYYVCEGAERHGKPVTDLHIVNLKIQIHDLTIFQKSLWVCFFLIICSYDVHLYKYILNYSFYSLEEHINVLILTSSSQGCNIQNIFNSHCSYSNIGIGLWI